MRRIFVNPYRKDVESRRYSQVIGSIIPYKVDFSVSATARGTTVSSAAWSSEGDSLLTFANEALASGVASSDVSASTGGLALAKCVATYADGNTESQYITIRIKDPE